MYLVVAEITVSSSSPISSSSSSSSSSSKSEGLWISTVSGRQHNSKRL